MPSYRVTFRFGAPRMRYEVLDIEAPDLPAAMREAAERVSGPDAATVELAEIRVRIGEEDRVYAEP